MSDMPTLTRVPQYGLKMAGCNHPGWKGRSCEHIIIPGMSRDIVIAAVADPQHPYHGLTIIVRYNEDAPGSGRGRTTGWELDEAAVLEVAHEHVRRAVAALSAASDVLTQEGWELDSAEAQAAAYRLHGSVLAARVATRTIDYKTGYAESARAAGDYSG